MLVSCHNSLKIGCKVGQPQILMKIRNTRLPSHFSFFKLI